MKLMLVHFDNLEIIKTQNWYFQIIEDPDINR